MSRLSRRTFLRAGAAATFAAPVFLRNLRAASPNETVRHASFGAAGMARADIDQLVTHKQLKLTCVAEVDLSRAAALKEKHPDLKVYQDWREMLDKEAANLDSANVSTPDHMHAPMAMSALNRGLNVYCQKPLAHDLYEVRRLTEVARDKNLVTQMGIQIHSSIEYRTAVALIQQGAIGPVQTVHTWSNKKWGDSAPRPEKTDPVPESLNWDMWLGTAAMRPYIGGGYYHPGNWRKRLDFGTGTFGDMGCHILDPVCKSLELTSPTTVKSLGTAPNEHNWSSDVVVEFAYPATKFTAANGVKLTWYDGDQKPSADVTNVLGTRQLPDQGSLFFGNKGALLLAHIAMPVLLPEKDFAGHALPQLDPVNHWHSFVDAVRGVGKTSANFDFAGPLTEMVLLGGVATFFPQTTLPWNGTNLQFPSHSAATAKVRREYRKGWEVAGLS
jgi:predicted dehydrogenase